MTRGHRGFATPFDVERSHLLLHAGLSRRTQDQESASRSFDRHLTVERATPCRTDRHGVARSTAARHPFGPGPAARGVTGAVRRRYSRGMGQSDRHSDESTVELLAAVGVTATDEGKARARSRIAEAEAWWTGERWAELRTQLGLPARPV